MSKREGMHQTLEEIEEKQKEEIENLNPKERKAFERAGERLRKSHLEKKRIIKEYFAQEKAEDKKWGVPHEKASTSKEEFIEKSKDPEYFTRLAGMKGYSDPNENFFSFSNAGGIFDSGVCWWHSRFQRAAIYLTTYRPDKPKCTEEQARGIIAGIVNGRKVLEINGFNNFYEFSKEFQDLIQRQLNIWQLSDGIFFWQWINGLAGVYETTSEKLKKKIDKIYEEVAIKKRIGYVKVQIKGLDAHAWLITEIELQPDKKTYKIHCLDSNWPHSVFQHSYTVGDTCLWFFSKPNKCVPYLQKQYEVKKYFKAIKEYQES